MEMLATSQPFSAGEPIPTPANDDFLPAVRDATAGRVCRADGVDLRQDFAVAAPRPKAQVGLKDAGDLVASVGSQRRHVIPQAGSSGAHGRLSGRRCAAVGSSAGRSPAIPVRQERRLDVCVSHTAFSAATSLMMALMRAKLTRTMPDGA